MLLSQRGISSFSSNFHLTFEHIPSHTFYDFAPIITFLFPFSRIFKISFQSFILAQHLNSGLVCIMKLLLGSRWPVIVWKDQKPFPCSYPPHVSFLKLSLSLAFWFFSCFCFSDHFICSSQFIIESDLAFSFSSFFM